MNSFAPLQRDRMPDVSMRLETTQSFAAARRVFYPQPVHHSGPTEKSEAHSERRLRILLVSVRADHGGGPEHVRLLIASGRRAVEFFVACPLEQPYWERFAALLPSARMLMVPHREFSITALLRLIRFCRESEIDLIHSHGKGAGLYSRIAALLVGIPCTHTFHGVHIGQYGTVARRVYTLIERCLSIFTARVIAVSQSEADEIVHRRLARKKQITVIPNGVEVPDSVTRDRHSLSEPLEIVLVTRFDFQKFTEFVVEIAQALVRRGALSRFKFRIIGTGAGLNDVVVAVRAANLVNNIECEGAVPSLAPLFATCFACLSTSRWEGMPLALLEAIAQGTPVIASDVVGNRDVVLTGFCGLLYAGGDADAAAEALLQLANEPGLWDRLSQRAWRSAKENFSSEVMSRRILEAYSEDTRLGDEVINAA
jgi:glycosyltransferase involved in cell wall biosynthesis